MEWCCCLLYCCVCWYARGISLFTMYQCWRCILMVCMYVCCFFCFVCLLKYVTVLYVPIVCGLSYFACLSFHVSLTWLYFIGWCLQRVFWALIIEFDNLGSTFLYVVDRVCLNISHFGMLSNFYSRFICLSCEFNIGLSKSLGSIYVSGFFFDA